MVVHSSVKDNAHSKNVNPVVDRKVIQPFDLKNSTPDGFTLRFGHKIHQCFHVQFLIQLALML